MKALRELAAFGGAPAFAQPVHVAQLNLPEWKKVEHSFREMFQRRYFANNGPLVQQLDRVFAEHLGVAHAVCVTNGTVGLMILARALELSGEVIVPAFTFPATVQALSWAGLTPILCDVSRDTHMITPATVAPRLSDRTAAILGVHVWGRACDPEGMAGLAAKHDLALFYDACHTVGCTHRGRPFGGFGDGEVFSFHATKVLNAAEGGCIATNDRRLADRLRTMRNFSASGTFADVPVRINGKMSEAQAALALLSLEELPKNIAANKSRYDRYSDGLRNLRGVSLMRYPAGEANNHQYIVLEIDEETAGLSQRALLQLLTAENVLCRRHFFPGLHRVRPYVDSISVEGGDFTTTERLCRSLLQLPTGQVITHSDIDKICGLIRGILSRAEEISVALAARE